jgi:hypothetical protein
VFSDVCPSSGILEIRKHNVSDTESVSVLRGEGAETPTLLGPFERANLNHWTTHVSINTALSKGPNRVGVGLPHLRMKTDPFSETFCSLVSRIPDDAQSLNPQ